MEGYGVGEMRRVNILYFLSREGKVEHPHLIRVYRHHSNGGVHLRDVKRWLSELRGKDMADAFAWSYKRQYRTGYVWQDLKGDDLITPISDNEYVLKGSRIPSSPSVFSKCDEWSSGEKTPGRREAMHETPPKPPSETQQYEPDDTVTPKPTLDLDPLDSKRWSEESEESAEWKPVIKVDMQSQEVVARKQERKRESLLLGEEGRRSASRKASQVLNSILNCRVVETNDSALRPVSRRETDRLSAGNGGGGGGARVAVSGGGGGDGMGPLLPLHPNASGNSYRKTKVATHGKGSTKAGEKAVPAVYKVKPAAAPKCSQCGKAFRPEKLYSHMKSCKALKGRANGVDLKRKPLKTESCNQDLSKKETPSRLAH